MSKTAVEWRQVGNKYFQQRNYPEALKSYTQSVLVATRESLVESSSKDLALAYANRSAALFYTKEYKVCLQDIELALEHGYPSELIYKLYQRRGLCMMHLGLVQDASKVLQNTVKLIREQSSITEEKRASLDKELQRHIESCRERNSEAIDKEGDIKTEDEFCASELIANASQAVCLKKDGHKGRHLVAKSDIPAGSDVIREFPYASVLLPAHYQSHCHFCYRQLIAPIPCAKCVWALYCSKQCLQSAWEDHHMIECPHRKVLLELGAFAWISLRIMLHSKNEDDKEEEEESRNEEGSGSSGPGCEIAGCEPNGAYKAQYKSVHDLMAHSFDQTMEELDSYKPKAAHIMTYFGDHLLQKDGESSDNSTHLEEASAKLSNLELDSKSDGKNKTLETTEQKTSETSSDNTTSVDKSTDLTPKALNQVDADGDKAFDSMDGDDANRTLDATSTEQRISDTSDNTSSKDKDSDVTPKAQNQVDGNGDKAFDSMDRELHVVTNDTSDKSTTVDKGSDLTPKALNQDAADCDKAFHSVDQELVTNDTSYKSTTVDKGSDRIFKALSQCLADYDETGTNCKGLRSLSEKTMVKIYHYTLILERHMKQLKCNAMAITAVEPVDQVAFPGHTDRRGRLLEMVTTTEQVRLATAVYPTASLMNHSCDPNVIASFNGRQLIVRAIKTIRAGVEILHCYGPHVKHMDTASRRKALQEQYFFSCTCTACESATIDSMREISPDWSNVYRCWHCEDPIVLKGSGEQKCNRCKKDVDSQKWKQQEQKAKQLFSQAQGCLTHWNNYEGCLEVLKECLRIRTWVLYKYHKDIAETQDCMAKCYASLGDFAEAGEHLSSSLVIVEKIYGEESIEVANELQKLAQIYFNGKQVQKAQTVIDRALRLFTLHYGKTHEAVQELSQMKECLMGLTQH